jgi:hypothetical protein
VLVLVAAAACPREPNPLYPTTVDLDRAVRAWNDPWLAPDATEIRMGDGELYSDIVNRNIGGRSYKTPISPSEAVLAEVQAAQAVGWTLTGAECLDTSTKHAGAGLQARASLSKSAEGLDRAVLAWVYASAESDGGTVSTAPAGTATPTPQDGTQVSVEAVVPNHTDTTWPVVAAVTVEQTCLGGARENHGLHPKQQDVDGGDKYGGLPLPEHSSGGARSWQPGVGVPDGLPEAVAEANADPVLSRQGLRLDDPQPWERNQLELGLPRGGREQTVAPQALAQTVDGALADGWSLTYTGCWASGLTMAELRRGLADDYSVVLRLTLAPDSAHPTSRADPMSAFLVSTAVITSPRWGGPAPESLTSVTGLCTTPTTEVFTWNGTPWFGPTLLAPIRTPAP